MSNLSTKIKIYANKEVDFINEVILQDDGNGVYIKEWNLNIPKPTISQLDSYESSAVEYEKAISIKNKRSQNYPSIGDQLDMLYWDKINGTNNWQESIKRIKQRYPK